MTNLADLIKPRSICPKCHTRVCMEGICNPPAPVTREEHEAAVAQSAHFVENAAKRLDHARMMARMAQGELEDAFARNDLFDINNRGIDADREWAGVERVLGYWQSQIAHDLRVRVAAQAAGVEVRV